ncbi:hypothetical protein NEMIN01_1148 [Nematocida minor]|uniref:uncharacterized protein n=1 Tax=Nematocida minor TaxID=1912983 RepID=UPI002220BB94|nr:uncharacterized protein NEMIN01_1148 [Nematocida minor]KAI5190683.1 hypothetical protein NEMIN01_1148 [Nematocida minor]
MRLAIFLVNILHPLLCSIMIDTLCCESPYYILILSLVYAMIFNRSKSLKYIPSINSFFFRFACCCIISVLVKYPFNGPRPEKKEYLMPEGWYKILNLSSVNGYSRILITPERMNKRLRVQPTLELYNIPVSFSQIKNRYLPRTGTPSSHSVISGYLMGKMVKMQYNPVLAALPMVIPIARVVYKHHYVYQVLLGLGIGYLLNKTYYL